MLSQGSTTTPSIVEKKQSNNALLSPIFRTSDMVIKFTMLPNMDVKALAAFSQVSHYAYALTKQELTKKVNETFPNGNTRLISAIINDKYEIVHSLLKAKANINQSGKYLSLQDLAITSRSFKRKEILQLLMDFKANPNEHDGIALYRAAESREYEMIQSLISAGFTEFNKKYPARAIDAITGPYAKKLKHADYENIEKALDVVTLLLNKKAPFSRQSNMVKFLLIVDQRKALEAFSQLCGRIEECDVDGIKILDPLTDIVRDFSIRAYTKKLKNVLTYSASPPDEIMKKRDSCLSLTPGMVDEFHQQIYAKRSYFSWFRSGIQSIVIDPVYELLEHKNG